MTAGMAWLAASSAIDCAVHSRILQRHGPSVLEVVDLEGCKWAIKSIDNDRHAIREAERLSKLNGHPLMMPLQSVFVDRGSICLQMPFYCNLRSWVGKIKVMIKLV